MRIFKLLGPFLEFVRNLFILGVGIVRSLGLGDFPAEFVVLFGESGTVRTQCVSHFSIERKFVYIFINSQSISI